MELIVFYEDKDIIVCEKPPGVPSQGDRTQAVDMVSKIKSYLREKHPERGIPYVAAVHRLDRPVGGIMVFAKTPEAAAAISRQIQKGQMEKRYLAVICGDFSGEIGKSTELCDYLKRDGRTNLSVITNERDAQAKKARLSYRVLEVTEEGKEPLSLLDIRLFTGRHHQIRVQLSHHLAGIWGDKKYNPVEKETAEFREIALYSWKLSFLHPATGKKLCFEHRPAGYPFSEFLTVLKE